MIRIALLLALITAACSSEDPGAGVQKAPPEVLDRILNERLYEEAMALLDDGDLEGVRKKAATLLAREQGTGFELAARAHKAAGELEEAVAALERGVEAHADDWLLWQFLGSARTDIGRYEGAEEAYTRAASCEGANTAWIQVDRAVLASARGDHRSALDLSAPLLDADHDEIAPRAFSVWIGARAGLGEDRHALAGEVVARIQAADVIHERLLWCLRELVALPSPEAHAWSLRLHLPAGPQLKQEGTLGAYARARVVAKSADDAVGMVRQLLSEARYAEVNAQQVEDEGPCTDLPRGVYELGDFAPYGLGGR